MQNSTAPKDMREDAIVMIADLTGYSKCCEQYDSEDALDNFVDYVYDECLEIVIKGGSPWWTIVEQKYDPMPDPVLTRELGDGVLYVWRIKQWARDRMIDLPNRLWEFSHQFEKISRKYSNGLPGLRFPMKIRFGLSAGNIRWRKPNKSRLRTRDSGIMECRGRVINLASKLQSYCRDLGFIASARLKIHRRVWEDNKYILLHATRLPGVDSEAVYVHEGDYVRLSPLSKKRYFVDPAACSHGSEI
jgi:class 3 adenylate cyclase